MTEGRPTGVSPGRALPRVIMLFNTWLNDPATTHVTSNGHRRWFTALIVAMAIVSAGPPSLEARRGGSRSRTVKRSSLANAHGSTVPNKLQEACLRLEHGFRWQLDASLDHSRVVRLGGLRISPWQEQELQDDAKGPAQQSPWNSSIRLC